MPRISDVTNIRNKTDSADTEGMKGEYCEQLYTYIWQLIWNGSLLWKHKFHTNPIWNGRRQRQPTPVLLPGKLHGWRNLVGYSPWCHKELDTTEQHHFLSPFFSFYLSREVLSWLFMKTGDPIYKMMEFDFIYNWQVGWLGMNNLSQMAFIFFMLFWDAAMHIKYLEMCL